MSAPSARPHAALVVGLIAASTAATLVRLAQGAGMPSLVLAAGRLLVATAVLGPLVLARHRRAFRGLGRRDWALLVASGLILAVHFATWISALEYTSVLVAVVLGSTSPIFVPVLAMVFLREGAPRALLTGIVLTVVGGAVIGIGGDAGEAPTRPAPLLGGSLAIVAAIAFAAYLVIGRHFRPRLHVVPYVTTIYALAAAFLVVAVVATGAPVLGHSREAYLWLLAVGLIPQLIGHSSFNYALAYLSASHVGLVSRLEPVGSAALAAVVLEEWPRPLAITGAVITIAGVALGSVRSRPPATPQR